MGQDKTALYNRLDKMWETHNFLTFFEEHSKHKPLNIKKGQIVFYEGDEPGKVYFIKKGFVKLYRESVDGKSTIVYLYGPGSMLGVRALTSEDKCLKHNAEALTDVEILTILRNDYLKIIAENPGYLIDLLNVFIDRLQITEKKLAGFITTDATSRVANFIAATASRFGQRISGSDSMVIPLSLTHQQIAEFVGAVRETVTVALHSLAGEGVISIDKGRILILDKKKLDKYTTLE